MVGQVSVIATFFTQIVWTLAIASMIFDVNALHWEYAQLVRKPVDLCQLVELSVKN